MSVEVGGGQEKSACPEMALKVADYCTIPANMGGFPAISLNCGFAEGLPIGFQIIGNSFEDDRVLGAAKALEALLVS